MGLIRHYLRVFFRSHFKPINPVTAKQWSVNSSVVYFMLAWSAFGFVVYDLIDGKIEFKKGGRLFDPEDLAKTFGGKENRIITIDGFTGQVSEKIVTMEELEQSRQ